MSTAADGSNSKPILPNPSRFQPSADPASIQVPGLDVTASVHDQIDQIEQLITFKLQNIDENFSKIQHILATRLLPAVKRYALGTEPMREAAKFWTSFYETAAQIRIPTYDDFSSLQDESTQSEQAHDASLKSSSKGPDDYEDSTVSDPEQSFSQAAFSSTPATTTRQRSTQESFVTDGSEDSNAPWKRSLESPLVRLGREVRNLARDDEDHLPFTSTAPPPSMNSNQTDAAVDGKGKGKAKANDPDASHLRHELLKTLRESHDKPLASRHVSPLKVKPKTKTPIPKKLNPYLPPNSNPAEWSGIVDLRDPLLATPKASIFPYRRPTPGRILSRPADESIDDSLDGLPPGMSPPRMMSPAAPPRSVAELGLVQLAKSPIKDAAERIKRDLLSDVQKSGGSRLLYSGGLSARIAESSMSTLPTPPSLSRYTGPGGYGHDTTLNPALEGMLRRVGTDAYEGDPQLDDGDLSLTTPLPADRDSNSDSDSDEINNTAYPSEAFLLASQQGAYRSLDDSDDSINRSGDSLYAEELEEGVEPVRLGEYAEDFDDSLDGDGELEEETLFGMPPAQREARMQAQRLDQLRMLGANLVEQGLESAPGLVDNTPTPWPRASHG